MNLTKLFEMQRELDERIIEQHGLQGEDLLPKKILALQVELGELAQEWRGFKFWSKDQQPRYEKKSIAFADPGGPFEYTTYPLLEEYIDCLHFILSIWIDISRKTPIGMKDLQGMIKWAWENDYATDTTRIFNATFDKLGDLSVYPTAGNYFGCFSRLLLIGKLLGFTWDQIEEAYMAKNRINHDRQSTGY